MTIPTTATTINATPVAATTMQVTLHRIASAAQEEATSEALAGHAVRTITARFKNPARAAFVNVPAAAWERLAASGVPTQYRSILEAVLDSAAKAIISKHLNSFSVWPSSLDAGYFAESALVDEATGANSDWLTKEEIEAAWRDSATRKAWVTAPHYRDMPAFRKAVAHYEALITKMAGKTTSYTSADLDLILAKMKDEDLTTDLGQFVTRRIEAIRNRGNKIEEVDCDLL